MARGLAPCVALWAMQGKKAARSGTKRLREPHKKQGIDDLNRRGFCVLTSFSSKVSPGRFPETSTLSGRGRREGFGEPPGGNAISCRAAAVEWPARPGRPAGPGWPLSRASRPPGSGDQPEPEGRHPRASPLCFQNAGIGCGREWRVVRARGAAAFACPETASTGNRCQLNQGGRLARGTRARQGTLSSAGDFSCLPAAGICTIAA